MSQTFRHRSAYAKPNKPFKGKSRAQAARKAAEKHSKSGASVKVPVKAKAGVKGWAKQSRIDRLRHIRDNKRQEILRVKRLGTARSAPLNVVLLPLGEGVDLDAVYRRLFRDRVLDPVGSKHRVRHALLHTIQTEVSTAKPSRVTVYKSPREKRAALDACKTADVVLAVMSGAGCDSPDLDTNSIGADDFAYDVTDMLKAQGLPVVVGVYQDVAGLPSKRRLPAIRLLKRFFQTQLPEPKVFACDSEAEGAQLWRYVQNVKLAPPQLRENRPYLVGETLDWEPNPGEEVNKEEARGTLSIAGFLRGNRPLSADHWVHLTGYGDFPIQRISVIKTSSTIRDTHKQRRRRRRSRAASRLDTEDVDMAGEEDEEGEEETMLEEPEMESTITLIAECTEAQESDEVLLPEEEAEEAAAGGDEDGMTGMRGVLYDGESDGEAGDMDARSAAQRVWEDLDSGEEEEGEEEEAAEQKRDHEAWQEKLTGGTASRRLRRDSVLTEAPSMLAGGLGASQRATLDAEQERLLLERGLKLRDPRELSLEEKRKLEADEELWPDEQDTPRDFPARDYFAQYRGLKSFHASPWDPYLNLPPSYSRIFRMDDADLMRKRILELERSRGILPKALLEGGIGVGDGDAEMQDDDPNLLDDSELVDGETEAVAYPESEHRIIVQLRDVPFRIADRMKESLEPVLLWGLLRYEHKISVLHFLVRRTVEFTDPIMNGEPTVFDTGFRRFTAAPVYSKHTQANKHLLCKFFGNGPFAVASVFAPITFPPGPVCMFQAHSLEEEWTGESPMIASGSLLSIDPQRLVIERIVLTGYPINVHKKMAVVRYMFWNPEDIRWFKPIELWTKEGLRGHIKESRGTKGYMKCVFDGHIKNSDIVCMSLYKRIYPPFHPEILERK